MYVLFSAYNNCVRAFYTFENPQVRRSAFYRRPPWSAKFGGDVAFVMSSCLVALIMSSCLLKSVLWYRRNIQEYSLQTCLCLRRLRWLAIITDWVDMHRSHSLNMCIHSYSIAVWCSAQELSLTSYFLTAQGRPTLNAQLLINDNSAGQSRLVLCANIQGVRLQRKRVDLGLRTKLGLKSLHVARNRRHNIEMKCEQLIIGNIINIVATKCLYFKARNWPMCVSLNFP